MTFIEKIGLGLVFLLGALALTLSALAHDEAILYCNRNLTVAHVKKVFEQIDASNGLLSEGYDRNDDGKADIIAQSSIIGATNEEGFTPHRANPVFWFVDIDFDGKGDKVYIDTHGEGRCEDIVLYVDLTLPRGDREKPPYDRHRDMDAK